MDGKLDRPVEARGGLRAGLAVAASLLVGLLMPALAGAEIVTIGTPTADFGTANGEASCTCTQYQLTAGGSSAPSWSDPAPTGLTEAVPAAGVIIDWRVSGSGSLALVALDPADLSVVGETAGGQSTTSGNSFPAAQVHIPVAAGDLIGVNLTGNNAQVKNSGGTSAGATIGQILNVPSPFAPLIPNGLLYLNADVALTPVLSSVTPTTGPTGGTNLVTISGLYLDGVSSVKFGTLPAAFTVVSPTEITAYAPLQGPGMVDVRVTAQGGVPSAISTADEFTYQPKPSSAQTPISSAPGTPGVGSPSLVLSPLSLSPSYFLPASTGASIAKTAATGATLRYTVSAAANISLTIQETLPGRLLPASSSSHGVRDCVAPNKATLPVKLPACPRYVSLTPTLTHRSAAGANVVHLSGRLNGHALAPGPYRLIATAVSTATPTQVSASVTHAFHILAPPKPPKPSKPAKPGAKPKAHAALPSTGSGAATAPTG
jgi:hypothetical protein